MCKLVATSVVLLAAGQSTRFGSVKQIAKLKGNTLLNHSINQFYQGGKLLNGIDNLFVVLGSNAKLIAASIERQVDTLIVQDWRQGMGKSIASAVQQLPTTPSHVFMGLADQVAISPYIVNKLLLTSAHHPSKIIAANYNGLTGVPAIFPTFYFSQLKQLTGDKGARGIIQKNIQNVVSLEVPEAAYDIDKPEDLLSFQTR